VPDIETARGWYDNSDPVHDFDHILRVYCLAEKIALAEGADLEIVRAAALLHDAEGSNPADKVARAMHHQASAEFAADILRAEGWQAERIAAVQHCIRAHRFRDRSEPPQTLEAKIIFDADKLDAIGAIGVARVISFSARIAQPIYSPPSQQFIETGNREPDEPYSSYHEYLFKLSKIRERIFTKTGQAIAEQRYKFLNDFFQRLIAEWDGEK
jgi:uncharacterized protein